MPVFPIFCGRIPKESENIEDCQDYFQLDKEKGCVAIADGASQSFYPSIWAELLVNHFCQNPEINEENWKSWLKPIQNEWLIKVEQRTKEAKENNKPTWIECENGLRQRKAATSTFIGLCLDKSYAKVCIIGDSCLFVIKSDSVESYLLNKSCDFNDCPDFFSSYTQEKYYEPKFFKLQLDLEQVLDQDENLFLVLATDALSEYLLRCKEHGRNIYQSLLQITSQEEFERFILSARNDGSIRMKSDDVTLVFLGVGENRSSSSILTHHDMDSSIAEREDANENLAGLENEVSDSERKSCVFKIIAKLILSRPSLFLNRIINSSKIDNIEATTSSGQKSQLSDPYEVIRKLKQQRAILGILVFLFLLHSIKNIRYHYTSRQEVVKAAKDSGISSQDSPKISSAGTPFYIPSGTTIYEERDFSQILLTTSLDQAEVTVLEEDNQWLKLQIDLFAYKSTLDACSDCSQNEIKLMPLENIRVSPSDSSKDIIGQLERPSKFNTLEFSSIPSWYKFRLIGYVEK